MDAQKFSFFFLLLLGAVVTYRLAPAYGAMFFLLAWLWGFAAHPAVAIVLAVAWLGRWLVFDFVLALIGGYGLGLGLRASRPRRSIRRRRFY
jgi:hypothetical protein